MPTLGSWGSASFEAACLSTAYIPQQHVCMLTEYSWAAHDSLGAGMKKAFDAFSICFQHATSALIQGCCSLLRPESNQPVAVRMEGLLSELCST